MAATAADVHWLNSLDGEACLLVDAYRDLADGVALEEAFRMVEVRAEPNSYADGTRATPPFRDPCPTTPEEKKMKYYHPAMKTVQCYHIRVSYVVCMSFISLCCASDTLPSPYPGLLRVGTRC